MTDATIDTEKLVKLCERLRDQLDQANDVMERQEERIQEWIRVVENLEKSRLKWKWFCAIAYVGLISMVIRELWGLR